MKRVSEQSEAGARNARWYQALIRIAQMLDLARAEKRQRIGIVIAAALFAIPYLAQGITAPFAKDQEPQSAQWIADMALNHHWLLCRDYYGYLCRKPPLYYWLSSAVVDLTGGKVDPFRTRAVSLIAATVVAVEVLLWSAMQLGSATAWLAYLFLLGSYGFASRATVNLTDMLLTALILASYCLVFPLVQPLVVRQSASGTREDKYDRPQSGWHAPFRVIGAGVAAGLAILDKGPVALALLGLGLFFFMLLERRDPFMLARRGWPWLASAVAIAIGAAWYLPAYQAGGQDFLRIVTEENFGHLAPAAMGGTGEAARPVYYIVMRLAGGMIPLSFLAVAAFVAYRTGLFSRSARRPLAFQFALALAVVFLFSLASAKRDDYILPAIPGLAIVFAALFGAARQESRSDRRNPAIFVRNLTAVMVAALVIIGLGAALVVANVHTDAVARDLALQSSDATMLRLFLEGLSRFTAIGILALTMLLGALALLVLAARRASGLAIGLALSMICLGGVSIFTGSIRPAFAVERSSAGFASQVRTILGNAPVYVVGEPDYDFSFYYGRAVPVFHRARGHIGWEPIFFVTRKPRLKILPPTIRSRVKLVLSSQSINRDGPLGLYQFVPSPNSSFHR
jgi:4-amino-4-deoxy-L-arabinose transferase-like glycosyltransferase